MAWLKTTICCPGSNFFSASKIGGPTKKGHLTGESACSLLKVPFGGIYHVQKDPYYPTAKLRVRCGKPMASENELQWIFHIEVLVIYIYILSVSLPQGVLQNPHL